MMAEHLDSVTGPGKQGQVGELGLEGIYLIRIGIRSGTAVCSRANDADQPAPASQHMPHPVEAAALLPDGQAYGRPGGSGQGLRIRKR